MSALNQTTNVVLKRALSATAGQVMPDCDLHTLDVLGRWLNVQAKELVLKTFSGPKVPLDAS